MKRALLFLSLATITQANNLKSVDFQTTIKATINVVNALLVEIPEEFRASFTADSIDTESKSIPINIKGDKNSIVNVEIDDTFLLTSSDSSSFIQATAISSKQQVTLNNTGIGNTTIGYTFKKGVGVTGGQYNGSFGLKVFYD